MTARPEATKTRKAKGKAKATMGKEGRQEILVLVALVDLASVGLLEDLAAPAALVSRPLEARWARDLAVQEDLVSVGRHGLEVLHRGLAGHRALVADFQDLSDPAGSQPT